ncbi:MAG: ABC transporter substrate-binding protein [Lachnospiraceae bacterium]|nr:ABC transporter substrate-binding protein [Lachnospiraceae bacterium]
MKKILALLTVAVSAVLIGCGNKEVGASAEVNTESKEYAYNSEKNNPDESKANANSEQVVIRVGYHYSSPYEVALAVAKEKGFFDEAFKDDNVTIEYYGFTGAGPAINEALLAGELDVAHGLGDQPCISGQANGNNGVIVSRIVRNTEGTGIIVKYDSEYNSIADLKGKTIAVGIGTAGQKNLGLILEDYGLKEEDVNLVNIRDYSAIVAAFENGEIDAAVNGSLAYTKENDEENKAYRVLEDLSKHPNFAYLLFDKEFLDKYPEISYKFVEALYKAIEWYYDGNVEEGDILTAKFLELEDDLENVILGNGSMELSLGFTDEDIENLRTTYDFLERNDILPDVIDDLSTTYDDTIIKQVLENNKQ